MKNEVYTIFLTDSKLPVNAEQIIPLSSPVNFNPDLLAENTTLQSHVTQEGDYALPLPYTFCPGCGNAADICGKPSVLTTA